MAFVSMFMGAWTVGMAGTMIGIGIAAWKRERCPEGWFHTWCDKDSDAKPRREDNDAGHYALYQTQICQKCGKEYEKEIYNSEPETYPAWDSYSVDIE